jgi:hypothetical protein
VVVPDTTAKHKANMKNLWHTPMTSNSCVNKQNYY